MALLKLLGDNKRRVVYCILLSGLLLLSGCSVFGKGQSDCCIDFCLKLNESCYYDYESSIVCKKINEQGYFKYDGLTVMKSSNKQLSSYMITDREKVCGNEN
jgi:hypothetical protein